MSRKSSVFAASLLLSIFALPALAQSLTLPPPGGNQRSIVTQFLGPVKVTIDYNSPDVTSPTGEDRTGKIWGQLVPYGLTNLGFGTCTECPWRAGANENTVFSVSHDVEIEGKPLPAGSYGFHIIPSEENWTLIFSKNSSSWGSFFYDPAEDALRVSVEPRDNPFHEWLTYEFTDRELDQATVELMWENLSIPFTITVPEVNEIYMASLESELRSSRGFQWQNWDAAAQFALQNGYAKEGLAWADASVNRAFVGEANFTTLSTLSQAQTANGMDAEAAETMKLAMNHPTATAGGLHTLGRQLIAQGRSAEALDVFRTNFDRFEGAWPTHVGMARGYSAVGEYEKAREHARKALEQAPDELNRQSLQNMIERLGRGEDVN